MARRGVVIHRTYVPDLRAQLKALKVLLGAHKVNKVTALAEAENDH